MKLQKWVIPLTLVLFISGFLLTWALHALAASDQTPWHQKNDNLVAMIRTQEREIIVLESGIAKKRTTLDRYQKDLTTGQTALQSLQDRLQQLKILSGMADVTGPGVVLVLDDNRKDAEAAQIKNAAQFKPEDFLIHAQHILYIVNELRVGGAEAISVNDQRIVNTTDIRCVGPMIMINTTRLAPPYTIRAIGNLERLAGNLSQQESEFNILKMAGYPVTLDKRYQVAITAYKGSYQFSNTHSKEGQ